MGKPASKRITHLCLSNIEDFQLELHQNYLNTNKNYFWRQNNKKNGTADIIKDNLYVWKKIKTLKIVLNSSKLENVKIEYSYSCLTSSWVFLIWSFSKTICISLFHVSFNNNYYFVKFSKWCWISIFSY